MNCVRSASLLIAIVVSLAGSGFAQGQPVPSGECLAFYGFENGYASSDNDPSSVASDLSVPFGQNGIWWGNGNPPPVFCLWNAWQTTVEQGPFNQSNHFVELTVTPSSGRELSLTMLMIETMMLGNTNWTVDAFAVYADEDPGIGGDNFQTKLGQLTNLFDQNMIVGHSVDLSQFSFLQNVSTPITLRLYFWDSQGTGATTNPHESQFDNLKLLGNNNPAPAKLGNRVWVDTDCNGIQDGGEPGLSGVTVELLDMNSQTPNDPIDQTTTSNNGGFSFCVPAGDYRLRFRTPAGHMVTNPGVGQSVELDSNAALGTLTSTTVTVVAGQEDFTIDAGFCVCNGAEAAVISLGAACGLQLDPVFDSTLPILGENVTLSIQSAFPNALVLPFMSYGSVTPTILPASQCAVFVDIFNPANLFLLPAYLTDSNGNWSYEAWIPNAASLEGLEITLQARLCAPNGPVGPLSPDWASNGIKLTLGCPPAGQ